MTKPKDSFHGAAHRGEGKEHQSVRVVITEVGRPLRGELTNVLTRSAATTDGQETVASLRTTTTGGGGGTSALSLDRQTLDVAVSASMAQRQRRAKNELLRKLGKCDAVVFVVDSAEVAASGSSSSRDEGPSHHMSTPDLSPAQVQLFLGVRHCLAEMMNRGVKLDKNPSSSSTGSWRRSHKIKRSTYPLMCVVANKQDLAAALSPNEVARQLGLSPLRMAPPSGSQSMQWSCQPCVATDPNFACQRLVETVLSHRSATQQNTNAAPAPRRGSAAASPGAQRYGGGGTARGARRVSATSTGAADSARRFATGDDDLLALVQEHLKSPSTDGPASPNDASMSATNVAGQRGNNAATMGEMLSQTVRNAFTHPLPSADASMSAPGYARL